jgi:hypothetical protein
MDILDEPPMESLFGEETEEPVDVLEYDENDSNLAESFSRSEEGREELRKLAARVLRDFDSDWESMDGYRKKWKEIIRLYEGKLPKKDFPWEGCAAAHVPILLENIGRLASRMRAEIFGDFTNVVGVLPVGKDDEEIADVISAHDNWQFRNEIPDFPRQMDRAILMFLLGDVVIESYRDELRDENRHETLTPDEFIAPFAFVTTRPDMSDLPRYTRIRRYHEHDLEAMGETWFEVEKVIERGATSWDDGPEMPTREAVAEHQKQDIPGEEGVFVILDYKGWLKLPGQETHRWCRVLVDRASQHVLWLGFYDEVDWRDQKRYEREKAEMESYLGQLGAYEMAKDQLVIENKMSIVALEESQRAGVAPNEADLMRAEMPPEPPMEPIPPEWSDGGYADPKPPRRVPISMLAHAVCLENLVGSVGLGVGEVLADYTKAANTALSQFTDSATLANAPAFLTTFNLKNHKWRPGQFTKVDGMAGGELQKNILPIRTEPGNPQLLELVDRFQAYGQSAAQAPDVLSGESGKSGETFRGISARIEQATKNLTVYAARFCVAVQQMYVNNARLNSIFLPVQRLVELMDDRAGQWRALPVGRALYQRDYRVEIRADLKFTAEAQRIEEANQLIGLPQAVPALQQNLAFQYETLKAALAARGEWGLIQALGMKPPPPMEFGMPSGHTPEAQQMMAQQPPPPQGPPGQAAPPRQGQAPPG